MTTNVKFKFESLPANISNLSDIGDDLDRIRTLETQAIFRLQANDSEWKFAILYLSTSEASNEARSRIITARW